jgi:L-ascorbate metabolism protein UlaG (beta-lactamase superfamily)
MSAKLQFLGFSSFYITASDDTRILIDPYLNDNPVSPFKAAEFDKVDLVLVSHGAFDHFGESADIAKHYGCPVICGGDSKLLLAERGVAKSQIIETTWGLTVAAAGIKVRPVESRHRSCVTLACGNVVTANPLGFVIYLPDGIRIYNASDTALFTDLKLIGELHRPHIGLMNVTIENCFDFLPEFLTGEMTAYEAALASQWLGLDYAVACHYTNKNCDDVDTFVKLLESSKSGENPYVKPVAMDAGQIFEYSLGKDSRIY